jgi:hypothetical protein
MSVVRRVTIRRAPAYGNGLRRTPWITLKTEVAPAMPKASERTAMRADVRYFQN